MNEKDDFLNTFFAKYFLATVNIPSRVNESKNLYYGIVTNHWAEIPDFKFRI